jgi:hypothetical protein
MGRKSGNKDFVRRFTEEELGRIERAAKRRSEAGDPRALSDAEGLLRKYREYLSTISAEAAAQAITVRKLAREFLARSQLSPHYVAKQRKISELQARRIKRDMELPTVGNVPLSSRAHWFNNWLKSAIELADEPHAFLVHPEKILSTTGHERLRLLAAEFIDRGEPLPGRLRQYVADLLREPLPPSPELMRRGRKKLRDGVIVDTLLWVALFTGLNPTRNRTQRTTAVQSICSIVSEVLTKDFKINLSEDSIEKLWLAHNRDIVEAIELELDIDELSQLLREAPEE